jgi:hypothetical protein
MELSLKSRLKNPPTPKYGGAGCSNASIVPKASNPIFAGALTKTAKNVTNGPGGVPGGVANFAGTNSYQNGHFVRG